MMALRRLLYGAAFAALALWSILALGRVLETDGSRSLLLAGLLGLTVGLPGLLHRRLNPLAPVVLLAAGYVLLRLVTPLPGGELDWHAQFAFYAGELRSGFEAYRFAIFPLPLEDTPGLELLVMLWAFAVVGLASMVALGGGRPLLGTTVLLALLAFVLTVDAVDRDVTVTLGFLALAVLVLLFTEAGSRRSWGLGELGAGLLVGFTSLGLAAFVLTTAPGIAAPAIENWRDWRPFGEGANEVVFNWKQNYPRLLDPRNEIKLMEVESPVPSYWQANTLEVFTGDAWLSRGTFYDRLLPLTSGGFERAGDLEQPPRGTPLYQRFQFDGISSTYLFSGGHILGIWPEDGFPDDEPVLYASPSGAVRAEYALRAPAAYRVLAQVAQFAPEELVGRGRDYPSHITQNYTGLPLPSAADISQRAAAGEDWEAEVAAGSPRGGEYLQLYELNRQIVGDASDPYEIALRLERHLRESFAYSLEVPKSSFISPYAAFLFDHRTGYCQHFAGSMTLLLRLNGIPSRVAVGFTTGRPTGPESYVVTSNNAHAWVEAYFPGAGWVAFDPTPGREFPTPGPSTASPEFESPFAAPLTGTFDEGGNPADAQTGLPAGAGADPGEEGGQSVITPNAAGPVRSILILALLLPLLALPPLVRWRGEALRSRRSPESRVRASVEGLCGNARDLGLPVSPASTPEQLARAIQRATHIDAQFFSVEAQQILYGGRQVTAQDVRSAETLRRRVERALIRQKGTVWSFLAWYGGIRFAAAVASADRRLGAEVRAVRSGRRSSGKEGMEKPRRLAWP